MSSCSSADKVSISLTTTHAALLIVIALAGCNSGPRRSSMLPTAPTPVAPLQSAVNAVNVRGTVYDTAYRPIAGAIIEVLDGPHAGLTATSIATGEFALAGAFEVGTRFRARSEGYLEGISRLEPRCPQCVSNFVNFNLGLPIAPANIAGDYLLTIDANEACTALPAEASKRTYRVRIVPEATQPTSANTYFRVAIDDGDIIRELAWDGVWIAAAGNYLELWMGDLHGQPGLVDEIDTDTFFSVGGAGHTTVEMTPVTVISARFDGELAYCVVKAGNSVVGADRRYACNTDRAVTRAACQSPAHRLTLAKR